MTEHEGFFYERDSRSGGWKLVFPNGQKVIAPDQTEQELRASIDELHRRIVDGTRGV